MTPPVTNRTKILLLQRLEALAEQERIKLYLIGGAVRGTLLGLPTPDIDIDLMVEGDAVAFAQAVGAALHAPVKSFPNFLTAKVHDLKGFEPLSEVDFAGARSEHYTAAGALPSVVPASILEDLQRRDFTINALAVRVRDFLRWSSAPQASITELRPFLMDLFGGLLDLDRRLVRVLHLQSFQDDPTRMFRACRYAARIGGEIEQQTLELAQEALKGGALTTISHERILAELRKIFEEACPARTFDQVRALGISQKLSLFDGVDVEKFVAALRRIEEHVVSFPAALRANAALRLLYYCLPEAHAEATFRAWSFGRRFINPATAERSLPEQLTQFSSEGLLSHFALAGARQQEIKSLLDQRNR